MRNIGFTAVLIFTAAATLAQENHKNELGLLLGSVMRPAANVTGVTRSTIKVDGGLTYQANFARKLRSTPTLALHLEFPFVATPSADVYSAISMVPRNYASIFVTPSLRFTLFPREAFQPWFSAGGGYGRFDESSTRVDQAQNTGARGKNTGALQFGGGVDIKSPVRVLVPFSLRAEIRDFYSGTPLLNVQTDSDWQHNVIVSGGIVLRF